MDNQERNREALIEHIAEQDRIIRHRNQQIGELHAINFALQGDLQGQPLTPSEALIERAEKAERERDEALDDAESLRRQLHDAQQDADTSRAELESEQPRPFTADDITDEMVERARNAPSFDGRLSPTPRLVREMLTAALTEPTRPEGAEKVEAVLHQYWSGDINGDDLADRIAEEMNR